MSLSPARQHRLRVQAEQAAREGGSVRHASGYDLMLLQLAEDRRRLKGVQSTVKKAEIKVELLPKYVAWAEGVLAAGGAQQDDVLMYVMLWRIDAGDYAGALEIGRHALRHGWVMPLGNRNVQTVLAEEMADAAQSAMLAATGFDADLLLQTLELTDGMDMPDQSRARLHKAIGAVLSESNPAYAMGSDLDQLAANYNVKRLTVTPADDDAVPPVAAVMESDEALRLRVPAAFEGLSVAGPTAAYEFHARSADGRVADASATSPAPAEVVLTVLSREGDGTAEKDLLDVVEKALNSENVRPVADRLTVRSAEIIPYRVEATIFLYPGPEAEPVMAAAKASLQKYIASQTRLGRDIRRSAIFAALHVEGVQRVELASPLADVVLNKTQAASCTQWSVTNGGTDE